MWIAKQKPWIVCMTAALFFFYEFMQINMFSALVPSLTQELHLNPIAVGSLSACYLAGDILLIFPAGLLLDIASPRKVILLAMLISILGTFMFSFAHTLAFASLGRFVAGAAAGPFCLLGTLKLISHWFEPHKTAFVTGIVVAFGMVGGIISQAPFQQLISCYGWRNTLLMNSCLGLAFLLLMYFFVQDSPNKSPTLFSSSRHPRMQLCKEVKAVALFSQNWLCGCFASLINLPILVLGATWGGEYLFHEFHVPYQTGSIITTMLYIGMLVGSPLFGYISDKTRNRRFPMLVGAIICLLSLGLLLCIPHPSLQIFLLTFFLIGLGSSSQIIGYPTVAESNPKQMEGTAVGLATTLIMSGGTLFQPLFGVIVDKVNNAGAYNGYKLAFLIFPIAASISIIILYFVKETYCKRLNPSN